MTILQEEVKLTVEQPDKIMTCGCCNQQFYVKHIKGKGDLLVMAEKKEEKALEVKCFGCLNEVVYPSTATM